MGIFLVTLGEVEVTSDGRSKEKGSRKKRGQVHFFGLPFSLRVDSERIFCTIESVVHDIGSNSTKMVSHTDAIFLFMLTVYQFLLNICT